MKINIFAASKRKGDALRGYAVHKGYHEDDVIDLCKDCVSPELLVWAIDNDVNLITEDWLLDDYEGVSMLKWCEDNNVNPAQLSNNAYLIKDFAVVYNDDDSIKEMIL